MRLPSRHPASLARIKGFQLQRTDATSSNLVLTLDLELLAPTIQVRGIVETAGRFGIIVNRKIYYEGARLPVEYNAGTVEIEVRRITGNRYTFAYRDAEISQRLAN